ncbi:hypothetical protein ABIE52_000645 [Rhodococcus sp. OAS809]|jgi:hypothetical protein|uniref:hypothetical protein n=1 Tax=Rhodococcus TaxID=1827 RepID=UPI00031E880D|nr:MULTISPECIES: hypothetical protein [Rhodococcus]OQM77785.1 hypothetical protein B0E55_06316 [Rhodococcus sp. 66b]ORI27767.1 hypothetical protein BH686_05250 [Rhodococcus erythropolis]
MQETVHHRVRITVVRRCAIGTLAVAAIMSAGCSPGAGSVDSLSAGAGERCASECAEFGTEVEFSCRFQASLCADSLGRKSALVRSIDESTAAGLARAWTGQSSSPIEIFDRSVDRFTSLDCPAAADKDTATADSGVRADRCAFLAASAEQQFRTVTLLLDPARNLR